MKTGIYLSIVFFVMSATARGQKKQVHPDLFSLAENHKFLKSQRDVSAITDGDKKGIRLTEGESDGWVWIEGLTLGNGVIELDLKGRDVLQKSFLGVAFHWEDEKNLDIVYFRPFNFRSTDSVRRIHAVQYVSAPEFGWKRLRDEQNGKYEKAIDPAPKADEWFHAKIVLHYPNVQVYVNGNSRPSLTVDQLSKRASGKVGLWVGQGSNGDFANLTVAPE